MLISFEKILLFFPVSTLIDFLFDVENPYELHSYIRQHLGQSLQANEFARRIIEWKGQLKANGISHAPVQNAFQGFPRYGMVAQVRSWCLSLGDDGAEETIFEKIGFFEKTIYSGQWQYFEITWLLKRQL